MTKNILVFIDNTLQIALVVWSHDLPQGEGKGVWHRQSCAHNVWVSDSWQQKSIEKPEQSNQKRKNRKNNSRKLF